MELQDFSVGFPTESKEKLITHISRLIPHLAPNKFVFVGGLVSRYFAKINNLEIDRPFNNIDMILKDRNSLNPTVTQDFYVYHYHPEHLPDKEVFYIVLVDKESKTKIDIYDYGGRTPEEIISIPFGDNMVSTQSLEDQLVETVADCYRVVNIDGFINRGHYCDDANILLKIADLEKAEKYWDKRDWSKRPSAKIWRDKKIKEYPSSIKGALTEAQAYILEHPESIKREHYHPKKHYECEGCVETSGFPITPMEEIYNILGYK